MNVEDRKYYQWALCWMGLAFYLGLLPGWLHQLAQSPDLLPLAMVDSAQTWPMGLLFALSIVIEVTLLILARRESARVWRIAACTWGLLALACTVAVAVTWLW